MDRFARLPAPFAASLALIFLAACEPVPDMPGDGGIVTDACGASGYQSLVGANFAAVSLPAGLNMRVIRPGEAVTMEFDPNRLNLALDEGGHITRVYCG